VALSTARFLKASVYVWLAKAEDKELLEQGPRIIRSRCESFIYRLLLDIAQADLFCVPPHSVVAFVKYSEFQARHPGAPFSSMPRSKEQ
jgi:hypothetical protein